MDLDEQKGLLRREKRWLLEEKYANTPNDAYVADCARLETGFPLDYLIGSREFLGCRIDLTEHPLIPRNETEYWVKQVIDNFSSSTGNILGSPTSQFNVLDIFSGSGCIGIAIAHHLPYAVVDCAEKNPGFVKQIQKNIELNNLDEDDIAVYQSDVFTGLPAAQFGKYDLILANPPYIAHDRSETVQLSVNRYEDHDSLYADEDGLEFVKQLIDAVPDRLKIGGSMYIEYDPWQTDAIVEYIRINYPTMTHKIIKDQFNRDRVIRLSFSD